MPVRLQSGRLARLVAGAALATTAAAAQDVPFVADENRFGNREDRSELYYCVSAASPDAAIQDEIGALIASALLLQPHPVAVDEGFTNPELDLVYTRLLRDCDVFLGFNLVAGAMPGWMTITAPYFEVASVLVVTDPAYRSLGDIPSDRPIGATLGSSADFAFIQYRNALNAAARWPRYPMSSDVAALDALAAGTVAAALVWGPGYWAVRDEPAYAAMRVADTAPLTRTSVGVGAVMLADQTFLRASLDEAIAALRADGSIQAILDAAVYPANAAP